MEHTPSHQNSIERVSNSPDSVKRNAGYALAKNITYSFEMEKGKISSVECEGRKYPITTQMAAMRAIARQYVKLAEDSYKNNLH